MYVPYAKKQNDPVLKERAEYELPMANLSQRGTVQYVPYTTILGDSGHYLGVYLPANYRSHLGGGAASLRPGSVAEDRRPHEDVY